MVQNKFSTFLGHKFYTKEFY